MIISSRSDGQNVESMQFGVTAGLQRGYNVVLFEGPGQMTPLFKNSVPFTPDWDKVVGPVLEWTKARADNGQSGPDRGVFRWHAVRPGRRQTARIVRCGAGAGRLELRGTVEGPSRRRESQVDGESAPCGQGQGQG